MNKLVKWISLLLAMVLMLSFVGCDKKKSSSKKPSSQKTETEKVDVTPYIGTWRGSDHNGDEVVHYLIFDENGYWNVYMNYTTLLKAIKQLPDQLVSFKKFRELQNSDHTGCYYEYVENTESATYTDVYTVDEDGKLIVKGAADVTFTAVSAHSGEPDETVVAEARDLFDRALIEAHS